MRVINADRITYYDIYVSGVPVKFQVPYPYLGETMETYREMYPDNDIKAIPCIMKSC